MYAYLNDLSIKPSGISREKILSLVNEFISVFSGLRDYKIEKLRVPRGFKSGLRLFESITVKELINSLAGETDYDIRTKIVTFLDRVVETRPSEHEKQLDQAQHAKLFEVRYDDIPSEMLSDAHILEFPVISFRSGSQFETLFFECEVLAVTEDHETRREIQIPNFFEIDSIRNHHEILLRIHHGIEFAERRWAPFENPSWRVDVTRNILALIKYPGNRKQLSIEELRSLNMNAAELVLDANGWNYNRVVTNYNKGKESVWKIYTNLFTNEEIYISVDLVEGEFEMQDRRGHWRATRFFDGSPTGKDYKDDKTHNIKIKN